MTKCVVLVAALAAVGCSKKDDDGGGGGAACKPLSVTFDGTALAALPHGLARSNNMNNDISFEVEVFNHDKSKCEEMLSKSGRTVHEGEVSVRAFTGGAGMMGKGVGIESHTQAGGSVKLISAKPKATGDVVRICADKVSFSPKIGAYKDKRVVIDGLFEGKYCGELKW